MDQVIVRSTAKLNTAKAKEFEDDMMAAVGDGTHDVLLDMDDTMFISSMALRTLIKAQRKLNEAGRSLKIINVAPIVDEVFDVTGLAGVLDYEMK